MPQYPYSFSSTPDILSICKGNFHFLHLFVLCLLLCLLFNANLISKNLKFMLYQREWRGLSFTNQCTTNFLPLKSVASYDLLVAFNLPKISGTHTYDIDRALISYKLIMHILNDRKLPGRLRLIPLLILSLSNYYAIIVLTDAEVAHWGENFNIIFYMWNHLSYLGKDLILFMCSHFIR